MSWKIGCKRNGNSPKIGGNSPRTGRRKWRRTVLGCPDLIENHQCASQIKIPTLVSESFKTRKNRHLRSLRTGKRVEAYRALCLRRTIGGAWIAVRQHSLLKFLEPFPDAAQGFHSFRAILMRAPQVFLQLASYPGCRARDQRCR